MTEEKQTQQATPSSAITALSVLVLVFGIIGLLGSFIPCLGMLAIYISIPTAIVGVITVIAAKKVNAPRGLAVAGLVIALIASGIAIAQFSALNSANNKLEKVNRELFGAPPVQQGISDNPFSTLKNSTRQAPENLLDRLHPCGLVNDYANVIPAAEENQLTAILTELKQKTGAQVVVVTLPSLEGGQINDFSIQLANRWGIGQKGKNNGVLLLGATQERSGNRLRIEVGYGLERIIDNATAGRILDDYVVPAWNQRQYGSAIASGAVAIVQRVAFDKGIRLSSAPQHSRSYQP